MDIAASDRAQELSRRLVEAAEGWVVELERLTPDHWVMRGVNAPEIRLGDDEDRPVGVIAHHVAIGLALHTQMIQQLSRGEAVWLPHLDLDALADFNARHSKENPHPDQAATLELLRKHASALAEVVRHLSDESLDHPGDAYGFHLTVEEFVNRIAIGHGNWHLSSIRATIQR